MSAIVIIEPNSHPQFAGMRMSADEFFDLQDDGFRYELINGVMVMSPSPIPRHQATVVELVGQFFVFLREHPVGQVFPDIDVKLDVDLVYRPDLIFIRGERLSHPLPRIDVVPDLVVEIISPSSRLLDSRDKKSDYERYGVKEYWLIDPPGDRATFYHLSGGVFHEVMPSGDSFASETVPGFSLDLGALRAVFGRM